MDRRCLIFAIFALAGTLAAQAPPPRTRPNAAPAVVQPAPVVPQEPVPPPPPPTPEQMPPTPPQVTYTNGQLSIVARNSTLRDILSAVGAQTGAHVDIPAGLGNERVVAQVGPGPARDVVASLLADSPLDYIILGSNNVPGAIASIMLTPTEGGAASPPPAGQPAQSAQPFRPPPSPDDDSAEQEPEPQQPPQPMPPQAQPQEPGPVVPGSVGQPPNMEPQQNPQNPSQVKTPEQLLQELQRMQQQQQQQQQPPPGPRRTIPQPHDQL